MSFGMVLTGVGAFGGALAGTSGTLAAMGAWGAVGAGVGQLAGGNTRSTLMGAGIGAGAGFMAGGGFGALGGGETALGKAGVYGPTQTGGNIALGAGGGSGWSMGSALANPLFLGATGLQLAAGMTGQGQAFQDKIRLSPQGRELAYGKGNRASTATAKMGGLVGNVRDQFTDAKAGKTPERAFEDINKLKVAEDWRTRASKDAHLTLASTIGNQEQQGRGTVAGGGQQAKLAGMDAGERAEGLFGPTSVLNAYKREELMNAVGNIQNVANMENQTAMVNYQGQLSSWLANQRMASQRGAAIGGAMNMVGGHLMNDAYMHRLNQFS